VDAPSLLPPYAHLDKEAVQCVAQASLRYSVPELLLHSILMKENGRTGKCSKNRNGTYDCGLAQINTAWLPHFAKYGITPDILYGNACVNIQASAYILRWNFERKPDWYRATIAYNIGPYRWTPNRLAIGQRYADDVLRRWWGYYEWLAAHGSTPKNQNNGSYTK